MKKFLTFDDVLLLPQFSNIKSRADVSLAQTFCGMKLKLPIISSNMDTVTGPRLCHAMIDNGAVGALHRFQSIEDNVKQFSTSTSWEGAPIGSFGLGKKELDRAIALNDVHCNVFLLDVAHGACMEAVKQVEKLREVVGKFKYIVVGNFASCRSIQDFIYHINDGESVSAVKVGIGGGAACTTRVQTGSGAPTFSSVQDCVRSGIPVIADGGIRNSGDVAKCLALGAKMVMLGKMLAGTDESPGEVTDFLPAEIINGQVTKVGKFKRYRGSASKESYEVQGKLSEHRTPEGEAFLVPYVGPVKGVLQQIEAGVRSAMSYSGAFTLEEFQERAEFIEVSSAGAKESGPHGKV